MQTYFVAKANSTALAFVVKAENLRSDWIILTGEISNYSEARTVRDILNESAHRRVLNRNSVTIYN